MNRLVFFDENPAREAKDYHIGGVLSTQRENFEKAISEFKKVTQIRPDNTAAWNWKGYSHLKTGELDKAMKCFNKSISINPRHNRACLFKKDADGKEEMTETVKSSENIKPGKSNPAIAWNGKGLVYYKLGRFEDAKRCFEKALSINRTVQKP